MSGRQQQGVDFAAIFDGLPTAFLVLDPDLVVVAASQAYLALLGRTREELLGRPVFDAFPPGPEAADATGANALRASFERVRDTGLPDAMPLYRYDVLDRATGQPAPRTWSVINAAVVDRDGATRYVVQRAEDVTDYLSERASASRRHDLGQRTGDAVEADVYARAQELRSSLQAESVAVRLLGTLADVALALSEAETVEDLSSVAVERGLRALGADGGGLAVLGDGHDLRLLPSASLGPRTPDADLLLLDALPPSAGARAGRAVLMADPGETRAWSPRLAELGDTTGLQAWAAVPLRAGDRLLGSLLAGWRGPRTFLESEVDLLGAFAAQCAQVLDRILVRDAERRSVEQTRQLSEALQRSLLTEPTQPEDFTIAVRYAPAAQEAQIGGDWYDAFVSSDDTTSLVIGDVAGHDRNAAALMGQVRGVLRGVAYSIGEPPAAVLSALDHALRGLRIDTLASAVLVQLDPDGPADGRRRIHWSNAGHPPPLLVQPGGRPELLAGEPDLLLGIDPATARHDHHVDIGPGATLVLYTDGLVESRDQSLDVGLQRLADAAAELAHLPLEEFCDALLDALLTVREDDVALLVVRAHG